MDNPAKESKPSPTPKGRPPRTRRAIYTIVMILVCLAIIEGGSRFIFHNYLNLRLKRQIEVAVGDKPQRLKLEANAFWHHMPSRQGYPDLTKWQTRGPDFEVPKPKNEFRIICLGESNTFGWRLKPVNTYPHQLQLILNKKLPGRPVKVINAGVPLLNSAFALSYLALRLIQFQPDVVVIKVGYGDAFAYVVPGMTVDYTHIYPRPTTDRISNRKFWRLAKYIYALRLIGYFLLDPPVATNFFGTWTRPMLQKPRVQPGGWQKMKVHKSYLRSMIAICRAAKIKVVLLDLAQSTDPKYYWPRPGAIYGQGMIPIIKRLNRNVMELAREMKVPFIDTSAVLKQADFRDSGHNTLSGNRKIARMLAAEILNHPQWLQGR